jgi:uncharacterized membrane protein
MYPCFGKQLVRGHSINLIFIVIFVILALTQRYLLEQANKRKIEEVKRLTADELQEVQESDTRIGDEALDYIYRL